MVVRPHVDECTSSYCFGYVASVAREVSSSCFTRERRLSAVHAAPPKTGLNGSLTKRSLRFALLVVHRAVKLTYTVYWKLLSTVCRNSCSCFFAVWFVQPMFDHFYRNNVYVRAHVKLESKFTYTYVNSFVPLCRLRRDRSRICCRGRTLHESLVVDPLAAVQLVVEVLRLVAAVACKDLRSDQTCRSWSSSGRKLGTVGTNVSSRSVNISVEAFWLLDELGESS